RTAAGPSFAKPLLDLALVARLRRIVREHRIDVVHAHNYEALLVALLAGKRPIVYHAHNVMADELPYYLGGRAWVRRFGRWLDYRLPHRADAVIAPHRRLAGHLVLRGAPKTRVHVIPPPVDASVFAAPGAPVAHPPVLYTGNLDAYQNLGLLQEAMVRVRRKLPDARLCIATAQPKTLPGAEHMPTPDFAALRTCLAEDAVVAVPRVSWSGYPIKLLNAMAAGKAVVACESSAYPVTHEQDGLVVPDNDPAAFAGALMTLLTKPKLRVELGRRARETVIAHHAPPYVAAQLEALDEALLAAWGLAPDAEEEGGEHAVDG
ncbi:MAG: glycosyltransferase family 4 protein, partial [Candidatus Hydrogenedentota bacterium]